MTIQIEITDTDILGSIDQQNCFGDEGSLGVKGGNATVAPTVRAAKKFKRSFKSQDWHPKGHKSWASTHGVAPFTIIQLSYGPQVAWPDHAEQDTPGADFLPGLDLPNCSVIVRKGMNPEIDSYSAFFENDQVTATGLAGYLRELGIKRIFLTGLARDYCVGFTALDAVRLGFEVYILEDAVAYIADESNNEMTERLLAAGVKLITTADLA
jgi:nicotinamidase/pyrazinamidase